VATTRSESHSHKRKPAIKPGEPLQSHPVNAVLLPADEVMTLLR
jgi:hypothetical protein